MLVNKLTLKEGFFPNKDNLKLFYRIWEPQENVIKTMILVHGFGEHSKRYDELVKDLNELPCMFAIFDLRGHGSSEGERVFVNKFDEYLIDLDLFIELLKKNYESETKTIYLLGHSMGGLIVLDYILHYPQKITAVVVSSPCLGLKTYFPFTRALANFLNIFSPTFMINNPIRPIFLTHDQKEVKQYKTDEFIQRRITVGLLRQMYLAMDEVYSQAKKINLPLLMLSAGEERIVQARKNKLFFKRLASKRKKLCIFDGFYHELFKEPGRKIPIRRIIDFINTLKIN